MHSISDFTKGAAYALRGFSLIRKPGIRPIAIAPFIINALLFALLTILGILWLPDVMDMLAGQLPVWLQWLEWLLWPILFLLIVFAGGVLCLLLAGIIAAPFGAPLSLATMRWLAHDTDSPQDGLMDTLKEALSAISGEIRKLAYFLRLSLPLLVISFIPVVQIVAPPLWFLLSAWLLAMEFADYPLGNLGMPFPQQRACLKRRRFLLLGFGMMTLLITITPLVNLLAFPVAIAGMTALVCREELY